LLNLAKDISDGMRYLSHVGIIHRDLKPANVLISDAYRAVVTDYGRSRTATKTSDMTLGVGTPIYSAPELINYNAMSDDEDGAHYGSEIDVYSFGMMLWEILTKKEPFWDEKKNLYNLTMAIIQGKRPTIDTSIPEDLQKLILACWHTNPIERPTFDEISATMATIIHKNTEISKNTAELSKNTEITK